MNSVQKETIKLYAKPVAPDFISFFAARKKRSSYMQSSSECLLSITMIR